MSVITVHASGRARAETAWARYLEPQRWPDWSPQITRVESSARTIAPGVTGRVHGPLWVSVDFVVETVDASAMTWAWRVHRGPVTLRLHHAVTATERGSRTSVGVTGPLPLILGYAPLARFALSRLVRP
ncbi:SRPBCC family protein [uncultured Jatrophihabitans sp.]|uniref:SRPBCC family protein n=1 Tax=uncultured Jatrophihabitans sp. TaxID=1610747 RepID=UPI0035C9E55F